MADSSRLHAQAQASAHADTPTTTLTTEARLLMQATDHADHLRETLKGLDALLLLLHGIENARGVDMQGPDLANLLQPLRDKAAHFLEGLQTAMEMAALQRESTARHNSPAVNILMHDIRDNADRLSGPLCGIDALLTLLHAPLNKKLPDKLTHSLAILLQPLHDQAQIHTEAIQSSLQLVRIRHAASRETDTHTTHEQGAIHA